MLKLIVSSVLLIFAFGCASAPIDDKPIVSVQLDEGNLMYTLGSNDNDSTVQLEPGDYLSVVLEANPSAGYSWEYVEDDSSLVTLLSPDDYPVGAAIPKPEPKMDEMGEPLIGEPHQQQLLFRAESTGTASLVLTYGRTWEEDAEIVETYSLTVVIE